MKFLNNWKMFNENKDEIEHIFVLIKKETEHSKIENILNYLYKSGFDISKRKFSRVYNSLKSNDVYLYVKYTGVVLFDDSADGFRIDKIYDLIDDEEYIYKTLKDLVEFL